MSNKNVIARVKLNLGQVGYFDDLTQIYLTRQNPYADVIAGMNCTTLVNAVKAGKICVVEGSIQQNSIVKKLFKLPQTVISAEKEVAQNTSAKAEEKSVATPEPVEKQGQEVNISATEETPAVEEIIPTEEVKEVAQEVVESPAEETKPMIVLPETEITLTKKGETFNISTSVDGAAYSTSDPTVALVARKSGKITAKAEGTAVITVSAEGYEDATCTVTVKYAEVAE